MNRMVGWFSLNGAVATDKVLNSCPFQTPHWQPDHQGVYVDGAIALSAMQRFITPQCKSGLMPHQHQSSGCVINADVYLTNRETLCQLLESDLQTADAILILQAYLKWGEQCTKYLAGQFCFMIWDPHCQQLFLAVDPFAQSPLFYFHQPKQFFMVANECSAFHMLYPHLTLNEKRLIEFARDEYSETETAYQQIHKLAAGHQLIISTQFVRQNCYWHWKDFKRKLPYHTREQYYEAFQKHFEHAVRVCLRRLGPLTTHISGGLDSSAVTAQAALLLKNQQQALFAFTSVPNELEGESYRPGWYYHELSRVEALIAQYSNIHHVVYTAKPSTDIFKKLKPLQLSFDLPLRNINNLDWTMASYEQVLSQQGRVLLIGAGGNGTISWTGSSVLEPLKTFYSAIKSKFTNKPYHYIRNLHEALLSGQFTAPLRASVYPLQLWYGVRRLDPTQELDLAIFCYNVPQWVYRRGKEPLQQRLLVREGLRKLLPDAISQNPFRGEQGADWYLHFNLHSEQWRIQLMALTEASQKTLWKCYDRKKIMSLFEAYPFLNQPPDKKITQDLCFYLLRCMSLGFYLIRPE